MSSNFAVRHICYFVLVLSSQQIFVSSALSSGAVEYTDCLSAEGSDPSNECPGSKTKQSDGEVPEMLEL